MAMYAKSSKYLLLGLAMAMVACKTKKAAGVAAAPRDTASAVSAAPSAPDVPTLEFRDEWAKAGGLQEFRAELTAALEAGNQAGILAAVSKTLEINPGTSPGPQGFVETWGLDGTPEKLAPLRALLQSLLGNGGCLEVEGADTTFSAPYYACQPDSVKAGCAEPGCGIAIRDGASFYGGPDAEGKPIGELTGNEIIPNVVDTLCAEDFTRCQWRKITRKNGQTGFVPPDRIRTIPDGYLWLVREEAGWKIRVIRGSGIPYNDN